MGDEAKFSISRVVSVHHIRTDNLCHAYAKGKSPITSVWAASFFF